MSFDATFALKTILPLAEVAYNVKLLPPDWKLVAAIEPGAFGFLATRNRTLVVAFRGTEHEREWLEDFDEILVANEYGSGHVHRGFQNQYSALRASVLASMSTLDYDTLAIVGHSLGGPLALQLAGEMAAKNPTVYTFEAPRSGWFDWAHWFDQIVPVCWRIENRWDVIPHVPHAILGYTHVGAQIVVDGGYTPLLHVAHSLSLSVGPGLQKLVDASMPKAA